MKVRKTFEYIKDNVKCCNCGFNGLVSVGKEICPECKNKGCLSWKENELQEIFIR